MEPDTNNPVNEDKAKSREKGVKKKEEQLYEPIRRWLELKEFRALIPGKEKQIVLPVGALFGVRSLEPDVVGYKKSNHRDLLTVVEAKADRVGLFDGLGRCLIYQKVADFVYLALPRRIAEGIGENSLYKDFGIGILSVDGDRVEERVKAEQQYSHRSELREILLSMVKAVLGVK
ncbi:MAG: hypothetical protein DSO07_00805 [Thermoproteota archaeon]|jgi:hypothetical protein|uniref:Uncharacterized protein n=1 Tax=Candidatus Methanodesulfokora washburnensis TaxID=2478471 RepID=A0A429GXU2_9CREN|nr:hypothetical protein [Candidatus Methanodesulfokores washburnensis]RSN78687.1 hypothetical protein D6D85_00650 [Candidatus Methanodesulfokores washburnensis]TDA42157.1 MAG: hypothetical protein DSO07_00805 [Candidatus Korarchaeota archaeon]